MTELINKGSNLLSIPDSFANVSFNGFVTCGAYLLTLQKYLRSLPVGVRVAHSLFFYVFFLVNRCFMFCDFSFFCNEFISLSSIYEFEYPIEIFCLYLIEIIKCQWCFHTACTIYHGNDKL